MENLVFEFAGVFRFTKTLPNIGIGVDTASCLKA